MNPALLFGLLMASIDAAMLSLIRALNLGWLKDFGLFRGIRWMVLPTLVYALQPWIFLKSLSFESLTVMNLLWDLISNVLVTLVGLLYFAEDIGPRKMAGVVLSFVAMCLLGC
jgi:multidrug transporter EmrE-like cation transporter